MFTYLITHAMNKRLCYFGFCLLLLTGCTSCKEQKEILIGTIGRIDTSRVTPVQDRLDSLKQAAARAVNKVPYLDSASKKIAIEPPYISADSLTMIRELWDSIVNDPLLGYFKVVFVSEDGTETEGYMHEDYGVIIIKTVNQPSRGIDYRGGIYWTGTETLPANYMSSDSAMHLYQFVDNMPEFPYRDDDRSFDDAMNAFKPRLGLSKGRHTVVRFVVEADGTVSNAHIIKSSTPRENYFARVIATYLLRFTPPTHRGRPCRVVYQLEL